MRKAFLSLLMGVVIISAACGGGGNNPPPPPQCSVCGFVPNARVIIVFPDGFQTEWRADVLGCAIYPQRNGVCGQVFPTINFGFSLTAAPSGVDLNAVPPTMEIYGQGMNASYGMPRVDYFDDSGYLVGTTTATYVSGDGTMLQAPVPSLAQAWSGNYQLIVTNMQSNGYYFETVGTANVSCWGRDRPDSDGDGVYDDMDCEPYNPSITYCGGGGGGGGGEGGCGGDRSNPQMECMYVY